MNHSPFGVPLAPRASAVSLLRRLARFSAILTLSVAGARVDAATFVVTNLDDAGPGSLRQALLDSILNDGTDPNPDTITFADGLTGQIELESGLPVMSIWGTTIQGPPLNAGGAPQIILDGNQNDRVLIVRPGNEVSAPPVVNISNLMIGGGNGQWDENLGTNGGGIYALFVDLRLTDCRIVDNQAEGSGGGIYVEQGRLELTRCRVEFNHTQDPSASGGGIAFQYSYYLPDETEAVSVIRQSTIANNLSRRGGGIAVERSSVVAIETSLLATNSATELAGGLYVFNASARLTNSTLSSNHAPFDGAARCTTDGEGSAAAHFTFRTITNNTADSHAGGIGVRGYDFSPAEVRLKGTIVSGNTLVTGGPAIESDLHASADSTAISDDYNLIRAPGNALPSPAAHDRIGTTFNAQLLPLGDNGGPTQTHALQLGSQALNQIPPDFFSPTEFPNDQRGPGFWRLSFTHYDIGAFESAPPWIVRDQPGYAESDFTLQVEATGALTPVTFGYRVRDLDGDVMSTTLFRDAYDGTVLFSVGGLDIPPGLGGQHFDANFSLPIAELGQTITLVVAANDPIYGSFIPWGWVRLVDTTAPLLIVNPSPIPVGTNPGTCSGAASYGDIVVSVSDLADDTPTVTFRFLGEPVEAGTLTPPTLTSAGAHTIVVRAEDDSGNATELDVVLVLSDTTPPTLQGIPSGPITLSADPENCDITPTAGQLGVTAVDACDAAPVLYYQLDGETASTTPPTLPGGTTTFVEVFARDASSNQSASAFLEVVVQDQTAPSIALNGAASITLGLGAMFVDPGVTLADACDSAPTFTVNVFTSAGIPTTLETCTPGTYELRYQARDAANNLSAVITRTVIVQNSVSLDVPDALTLEVNPTDCTATVNLPAVVGLAGGGGGCSLLVQPSVRFAGEAGFVPVPFGDLALPAGTSDVRVQVFAVVDESLQQLADETFAITVLNPFDACADNIAWPLAKVLALSNLSPTSSGAIAAQFIARPGESRWFKFTVAPGGQIDLTLTNLPANFDLVIYGDIQSAYDELAALAASGDPDEHELALLGTEFAAGRRSPEAYSPDDFAAPEAYSPDAFAARKVYSPEAYSPDGYAAPEAYSPDVFAAPEAYSPEDLAARKILSPEAYSPDAYSAAQQRSLLAFSAAPGTISEGIRFNTYTLGGTFYVRVRGQQGVYSADAPFTLTVTATDAGCGNTTDLNTTPATAPAFAGAPTSLFVWDSTRTPGTTAEVNALATSLGTFATAVNGAVLNLATDARIVALNAQADANPFCPLAKNILAEAIRNLIQNVRAAKPSIADVTLIGNDEAIPFFRTPDEASIGNEILYFPPVQNPTHSQTSLRSNLVLTQDRYGASQQLVLVTGPYDLPEIPVARLVETAAEVTGYLNAYLPLFSGPTATGGVLPTPTSGYVAAYDFMADSGAAIQTEFAAGLGAGGNVTGLIADASVPPSQGWTADDLRAGFLGARRDVAHLAAHFSTSSALAADYTTRFRAEEVATSTVDLRYALILSNGCHSGYNTVDAAAIAGVTDTPDWAQAFARKHALWVAGTGYQYGDTDFIDYTERLLLEYAKTLRAGTGPVSIGRALVDAKRRYLSDTAEMRGIHEKSLLQLALYGLPMVKINFPVRSTATATPPVAVTSTTAVAGPGATHGLKVGELTINSALTRVDLPFDVFGGTSTVNVSYYTGANGVVAVPHEPLRPLESRNIHRPADGFARGVGFRGGVYVDLANFRPFTGAPGTELSTVHGRFDAPTWYPVSPWSLNHVRLLALPDGYSVLNAYPTQFISSPVDPLTNPAGDLGTARRFDQMRFSVFYCPAVSPAALANGPALNIVSSEVEAAGVHFSVDAVAVEAAGVQEVWITYTGLPGSSLFGSWQSFSLTAPASASGNGTWTGILPLPSPGDAPLFRYFVQAVNGFGVVSSITNVGRYFSLNTSTLDEVAAASTGTMLAFVGTPPASAPYGTDLPLQARLADAANTPLAGKVVTFRFGSAALSAVTNGSGIASATLKLLTPPAADDLQATFAGDADYANAGATRAFTVSKQASLLALAPDGTGPDATHIFATLAAPDGSALKERTIIFLANNGTATTALTSITNGAGAALLSPDALPAGTYQVSAYFGQTVNLPGGGTVTLLDPLYLGSQDSGTFTIGGATGPLPLTLTKEKVIILYNDTKAPGATTRNRGHSQTDLAGVLAFTDPALDPAAILATPNATTVRSHLRATLSGKTLFDGDVPLQVLALTNRQWTGSATIAGARASVLINWLPPSFKSALSDPTGPKLETTTLTPTLTLLTYKPVAGNYTTTIGSGAGSAVVTVKSGKVTKITGGLGPQHRILSKGASATVALPFALAPGNTVITAGSINRTVVVTAGVNYFGSTGVLAVQFLTPPKFGPLYNATPAILTCEIALGTGPGEHPAASTLTVGDAAKPWTTQVLNSRTRVAP